MTDVQVWFSGTRAAKLKKPQKLLSYRLQKLKYVQKLDNGAPTLI